MSLVTHGWECGGGNELYLRHRVIQRLWEDQEYRDQSDRDVDPGWNEEQGCKRVLPGESKACRRVSIMTWRRRTIKDSRAWEERAI